jgi:hypothetical protein
MLKPAMQQANIKKPVTKDGLFHGCRTSENNSCYFCITAIVFVVSVFYYIQYIFI